MDATWTMLGTAGWMSAGALLLLAAQAARARLRAWRAARDEWDPY
ncbi:hypothetical protein [Falsiroseomonas oryziterrae]|nr:hypothetical protein [Roseomonas sp. NPKOSM-4]